MAHWKGSHFLKKKCSTHINTSGVVFWDSAVVIIHSVMHKQMKCSISANCFARSQHLAAPMANKFFRLFSTYKFILPITDLQWNSSGRRCVNDNLCQYDKAPGFMHRRNGNAVWGISGRGRGCGRGHCVNRLKAVFRGDMAIRGFGGCYLLLSVRFGHNRALSVDCV